MRKLIVIGGGEHARVVVEAARTQPNEWTVAGFVDPQQCRAIQDRHGVARVGRDEEALSFVSDAWFVVAIGRIGSASLRRSIASRFSAAGARWARIIHRSAWISPTAVVGDGAVVLAGASVNSGARLGDHCIINTGCVVEHDVQVGSFAMAAPGAVIGGHAAIGEDSYLGLGCRIRDHISIGSGTIVGMGAVVVASLPGGVEAVGAPARVTQRSRYA